ncbi:hypothetical protein [Vibrio phage CAU_VPP01]|nr:hypothetical protein [Vibrio phage CAU_VPP01]
MPIMETRGGIAYVAIRAIDLESIDTLSQAIETDLLEKPAIEGIKVYSFANLVCAPYINPHVHREVTRLSKDFKYRVRIIKVYLKPNIEHIFAGCKINTWIECRTRKFRKAHEGCCAAAELIAITGGVATIKHTMHPPLFD